MVHLPLLHQFLSEDLHVMGEDVPGEPDRTKPSDGILSNNVCTGDGCTISVINLQKNIQGIIASIYLVQYKSILLQQFAIYAKYLSLFISYSYCYIIIPEPFLQQYLLQHQEFEQDNNH